MFVSVLCTTNHDIEHTIWLVTKCYMFNLSNNNNNKKVVCKVVLCTVTVVRSFIRLVSTPCKASAISVEEKKSWAEKKRVYIVQLQQTASVAVAKWHSDVLHGFLKLVIHLKGKHRRRWIQDIYRKIDNFLAAKEKEKSFHPLSIFVIVYICVHHCILKRRHKTSVKKEKTKERK